MFSNWAILFNRNWKAPLLIVKNRHRCSYNWKYTAMVLHTSLFKDKADLILPCGFTSATLGAQRAWNTVCVQRNNQSIAIWNQSCIWKLTRKPLLGRFFSPCLNAWMFLFTELHICRSARSQHTALFLYRAVTGEYHKGTIWQYQNTWGEMYFKKAHCPWDEHLKLLASTKTHCIWGWGRKG